jgi:uncharacterized surface protein with fasciclin (FAS1) repeats
LNDASSLKDILTYHLVPFKISPTLIPSVHTELTLPSVQGEIVRINVYRKKGSSFSSETVRMFLFHVLVKIYFFYIKLAFRL